MPMSTVAVACCLAHGNLGLTLRVESFSVLVVKKTFETGFRMTEKGQQKVREASSTLQMRLDSLLHGRKDTSRTFCCPFSVILNPVSKVFFTTSTEKRSLAKCETRQPQVPMVEESKLLFLTRSPRRV